MVLSLQTPIGSNFISNFPAQNAVNSDLIDDYAGAQCLRTHALGTYTPVLTAATTNPTLGAGSTVGYYYKIFDQIITWGFLRFGAGMTVGSGAWIISLPFKVKNSILTPSIILANGPIIGNGFVWQNFAGSGRQPVSLALRTNQTFMMGLRMNSGAALREVTNAAPIAWASTDGIKWCARYQRDPT